MHRFCFLISLILIDVSIKHSRLRLVSTWNSHNIFNRAIPISVSFPCNQATNNTFLVSLVSAIDFITSFDNFKFSMVTKQKLIGYSRFLIQKSPNSSLTYIFKSIPIRYAMVHSDKICHGY